jgi:hypothetical protein
MRNTLFVIAICLLSTNFCFSQTKKYQTGEIKIKETIIGFLKWYKAEQKDTSNKGYSFIKGGYPDTTTQERIDRDGIEKYLDRFRKSGFVSETYINDLRGYFVDIEKLLEKIPKHNDLVKIPGMDIDFVLQTFEPEAILDHIDSSRIEKLYIIYNKALIKLHVSQHIDMLFILTKRNDKWLIDYAGHDATDEKSFFRQ